MKSSTYGSIATIAFIKNRTKVCKSIDSAIKITDKYCKRIKLDNKLSYMTKYRVLSELINSNIIEEMKDKRNCKLKLSSMINDFLR